MKSKLLSMFLVLMFISISQIGCGGAVAHGRVVPFALLGCQADHQLTEAVGGDNCPNRRLINWCQQLK
jgi:hypothetical protein